MSKIIFKTDELAKALEKANEVIDPKHLLPITTNVLLKVVNTDVTIQSTDIEITKLIAITCENPEADSFDLLIPIDILLQWVKLNHNSTTEFEIIDKKLILKGLNDTVEVDMHDSVKEYPKMPAFPATSLLTMKPEFVEWVSSACVTVSDDKLRRSMTMVCVELKEQVMNIVSTNSNVLYKQSSVLEGKAVNETILLNEKAIKALKGLNDIEVCCNETHVAFKSGNITVIVIRFAEKYVDYRAVIPTRVPNIEFDRKFLIDAFEKVLLIAGSDKGNITNSVTIDLKGHIGKIRIAADDISRNRSIYVDVPADYTGECATITVNAKNMLKLLKQVSFEILKISIDAAHQAIVLYTPADDGYLSLIMPIMSNK